MIVTWGGAVRQLLSKLSMRFGVIKFILVMQKTQEKVSVGIFLLFGVIFEREKLGVVSVVSWNLVQNCITITSGSYDAFDPIKI